jgi:hypothetical protein
MLPSCPLTSHELDDLRKHLATRLTLANLHGDPAPALVLALSHLDYALVQLAKMDHYLTTESRRRHPTMITEIREKPEAGSPESPQQSEDA